ncbi:hypothetical protein [Holophaga foetida]|uniref:hypothetical protein n=1 Tax=Holophaga foetida TaxID=35839 RepID=UPI000247181E|nr:hypothetical protein [Holophaga foetida]
MAYQPAFSAPGVIRMEHDPSSKALIVHWEKFHNVKEMVDKCNSEGKRLGAKTLIVEVPAGLVLKQEDAAMFQEYVPKNQLAAGMTNLINIVSSSAVTNMASKRWKEPSKQCGLTVYEAPSVDEALKIAKQNA